MKTDSVVDGSENTLLDGAAPKASLSLIDAIHEACKLIGETEAQIANLATEQQCIHSEIAHNKLEYAKWARWQTKADSAGDQELARQAQGRAQQFQNTIHELKKQSIKLRRDEGQLAHRLADLCAKLGQVAAIYANVASSKEDNAKYFYTKVDASIRSGKLMSHFGKVMFGNDGTSDTAGIDNLRFFIVVVFVAQIAHKIHAVHNGGRVHGHIDSLANKIMGKTVDCPDQVATLRLGGYDFDVNQWPLSVFDLPIFELPTEIDAAHAMLRELGSKLDPIDIDLHQIAVLLWRMLTGKSIELYLHLPSGPKMVPSSIRTILDRAMGLTPPEKFESMAEFARSLERVNSFADDRQPETDHCAKNCSLTDLPNWGLTPHQFGL